MPPAGGVFLSSHPISSFLIESLHETSLTMGRWPDNDRSTLVTAMIMFLVFPLLAFLAWWFVKG